VVVSGQFVSAASLADSPQVRVEPEVALTVPFGDAVTECPVWSDNAHQRPPPMACARYHECK
jgi:hypothetical protein